MMQNAAEKQRVRQTTAAKDANATVSRFRVLMFTVDQFGQHWIRYGNDQIATVFEIDDVESGKAFDRLKSIGAFFLSPASKNAFKTEIEQLMDPLPASVARGPGWIGQAYVHGDGTCYGNAKELILGFDPSSHFAPKSTLDAWKSEIGPLVSQQPVILGAMTFALTGIIVKFAGNDSGNPIAEIVMEPHRGKTSVLKLISSFWGDCEGQLGLGVELNSTLAALEEIRLMRSDGLLCLDETNHGARSGGSLPQFLNDLIFMAESSASRRRMGATKSTHSRMATFITTNKPISTLIAQGRLSAEAAASRILSINIGNDLFVRQPEGYQSSKDATEALAIIGRRYGGVVSHAFTKALVAAATKNGGMERYISQRVAKAERGLETSGRTCSPRVLKMFALMIVVADLCREFGIFNASWWPRRSVNELFVRVSEPLVNQLSSEVRVRNYAREVGIVRIDRLTQPIARLDERGYGFEDKGRRWIAFDAASFKVAFPDWRKIVADLRRSGLLKTEGGKKPTTTIKAPRQLCHRARVFCISAKILQAAAGNQCQRAV